MKEVINLGTDMPGGDNSIDGKYEPHLLRAATALKELAEEEYKNEPVLFHAYVDAKNRTWLENELGKLPNVTITETEKNMPMDGDPEKWASQDTTILRMAKDLRKGTLDVIYSSGNSGAVVSYALNQCGPLSTAGRHSFRPSLVTRMPFDADQFFYVNDVGAWKKTKPRDLFISAVLTQVFAECVYEDKAETTGMLNMPISEQAEQYFERLPGYQGIITPEQAFEGRAKTVSIDGFRGNIFLKTTEAVVKAMQRRVKHATLPQQLIENDKLLLDKFASRDCGYGREFRTTEYYATIWPQIREMLAKKPSRNLITRLNDMFARIPGRQKCVLVTGANLDEILKNIDLARENSAMEPQHIGDALDMFTYAVFKLLQNVYHAAITEGREDKTIRTGVLSNGEEEIKGDDFAKKLREAVNTQFVEPEDVIRGETKRELWKKIQKKQEARLGRKLTEDEKDLLEEKYAGKFESQPLDIIATDSHTAAIFDQTVAAVEKRLGGFFQGLLTPKNLFLYKFGKRGPLYALKKLLNPNEYNGSPVLGINGYALVGHGTATTIAIKAAIRNAINYRRCRYLDKARKAASNVQEILSRIKPDTTVRSHPE